MDTALFLTFEKFPSQELAGDLVDLLTDYGVPFRVEDSKGYFDPTFSFNDLNREVLIKIRPMDFERVNGLYDTRIDNGLSEIPGDYYLFGFSDKELKNILIDRDAWGRMDQRLAIKILKERGVDFQLDTGKDSSEENMYKPSKTPRYLFSLFIVCIVIFPVAGIVAGWIFANSKKTLQNGKQVFLYDQQAQFNGKVLLIFSLIAFLIFTILRLFTVFRWPFFNNIFHF